MPESPSTNHQDVDSGIPLLSDTFVSFWTSHKLNRVGMTEHFHFGKIAKFMNKPGYKKVLKYLFKARWI